MTFLSYKILTKHKVTDDTYIFQLAPQNDTPVYDFKPGQYAEFQNPEYSSPEEIHRFSFASTPYTRDLLEFCVKLYGPWTHALAQLQEGADILISPPQGEVLWGNEPHAVFLVGGVGIAPIMSILRTLAHEKSENHATLLYGSRTPEMIVYKKEVETILEKELKNGKLAHILSDVLPEHAWSGYQGFITPDILKQEVDLGVQPTFYMYGPTVFIVKMLEMLKSLGVSSDHIKHEMH